MKALATALMAATAACGTATAACGTTHGAPPTAPATTTTAPPEPATAPTTAPPPQVAAPPPSPRSAEAPAGVVATSAEGPGTEGRPAGEAETLACIRQWETGGGVPGGADYGSHSGPHHGAYQFTVETWNGVASRHRAELVGVNPADASPADQDAMAAHLLAERGLQPWPTPSRRCA